MLLDIAPGSIFVDHTLLRTKSAGFIYNSVLNFYISRLWSFCIPNPCPTKITFIYNTMLNFILVLFCTAYIFVTVRVRARVGVRVRDR